jgi:hypothetical protein
MNRGIALEDERRGHEDRMKDRKRMGDREHFDRSSQRPRDGPSSMMRGSFCQGITSMEATSEEATTTTEEEGASATSSRMEGTTAHSRMKDRYGEPERGGE